MAITQDARSIELTNGVVHSMSDTSYWQTQTTGITGDALYALSAVDGNVCWLAGASGRIIRTVNGGNTWLLINPGIIDTQDIHVF